MNTTHTRAKKGGEFGANGEWYEGGKFINTIPENEKKAPKAHKSTGREEFEPYKYAVTPEGMRPIYRLLAGAFGKVINGKMEIVCSQETLNYFQITRQYVQDLADKYNAGIRYEPRKAV